MALTKRDERRAKSRAYAEVISHFCQNGARRRTVKSLREEEEKELAGNAPMRKVVSSFRDASRKNRRALQKLRAGHGINQG